MPTTINADTVTGGAVVTGDTSGVLQLQTGGTTAVSISTGQVVTFTNTPVISGGATVVTTTGTQTLTNKTIAFGSNTFTGTLPVANGGTNATATPTAGAVAYGTGTAYAFTSAGTSGQVLTSAGSGAPTWATPSAGALVFLSSQTVTGSPTTVDFTSGINSTYDDYFITFENVTFTSVGGNYCSLAARLQQSGSFQTGNVYDYGYYGVSATSSQVDASVNVSFIDLMIGRSSSPSQTPRSGFIYLLNVNSTTSRTCHVLTTATVRGASNGTSGSSTCGGTSSVAAAVTGIQFLGNISLVFTAGTFRLYGIAKS